MISQKSPLSSNGKASISTSKTTGKRSFSPSPFDNFDAENVDPSVFMSPSKKNKTSSSDGPAKPFSFSLTPSKPMAPPSNTARFSTPARANMSSPHAPLTAPAGRSPKRKTTTSRRISAPYTRISPPASGSIGSSMPFSLNAALSGTLSSRKSAEPPTPAAPPMPKTWFFDIYEDTPEEESATLMEHSTLTLDLSSEEEGWKRERSEKGKENVPPEGYDAVAASRAAITATEGALAAPAVVPTTKKTNLIRKKLVADEGDMDDGERAALEDLETEHFFSEGLSKESHIIVQPDIVEPATASKKLEILVGSSKKSKKPKPSPLQDSVLAGDEQGIAIFEDKTAGVEGKRCNEGVAETFTRVLGGSAEKRKRGLEEEEAGNENAVPAAEV